MLQRLPVFEVMGTFWKENISVKVTIIIYMYIQIEAHDQFALQFLTFPL